MLMVVCNLCTNHQTHNDQNLRRLGKHFRKYNRSLKGLNMEIKRYILSKPQGCIGIFTFLASAVLPALISSWSGK